MTGTPTRLLRLLSLLQARRDWSGNELAQRLGVTTRTVRKDMERLRSLGYPVHALPGPAGGYQLGAGASLPPLLLDDEEAVAVAVGLRTAASGTVRGIEETSARALAKLEQVLPARLRRRVNALQTYTVAAPGSGPTVPAQTLTEIANACRDYDQLRFGYRDHHGAVRPRRVEPHRLVHAARRWYLLGWDTERADWRSFRVDRLELRTPTGPRFTPRELPAPDAATFVSRGVAEALWSYRARVRLHVPAEAVAADIPPTWSLEAGDEHSCVLDAGADSPGRLAVYLAALGVGFEATGTPELAAAVAALGERCALASQDPAGQRNSAL